MIALFDLVASFKQNHESLSEQSSLAYRQQKSVYSNRGTLERSWSLKDLQCSPEKLRHSEIQATLSKIYTLINETDSNGLLYRTREYDLTTNEQKELYWHQRESSESGSFTRRLKKGAEIFLSILTNVDAAIHKQCYEFTVLSLTSLQEPRQEQVITIINLTKDLVDGFWGKSIIRYQKNCREIYMKTIFNACFHHPQEQVKTLLEFTKATKGSLVAIEAEIKCTVFMEDFQLVESKAAQLKQTLEFMQNTPFKFLNSSVAIPKEIRDSALSLYGDDHYVNSYLVVLATLNEGWLNTYQTFKSSLQIFLRKVILHLDKLQVPENLLSDYSIMIESLAKSPEFIKLSLTIRAMSSYIEQPVKFND